MNKKGLISAVEDRTGYSKIQVEEITDHLFNVIAETLASGEEVGIMGFGVFEVRRRKSRKGVNPRTFEPMIIPERKIAGFRQGKKIKEMLMEK